MNKRKIKRAIISVSNKSNLKFILPILKRFKIQIISSGGTYNKIKRMNYNCIEVSDYTGLSEMLNGRIKTLHSKIYAGILNIRSNKNHKNQLKKNNIPNIDLVIVDLYPFERQHKKKSKNLIEFIDIGGPTLIRAAAKNFNDVCVVSNINDYDLLAKELKNNNGATSAYFRKLMAGKAFGVTAYYDSSISNWLNNQLNIKFPETETINAKLIKNLRYGENPHQEASLYAMDDSQNIEKIHGKELSYNNYNDIYSAISVLHALEKKEATVIIKHANPCGVSVEKKQIKSYLNALACDPISAFGGIVGMNSVITKKLALVLNKNFFEVIVAKGFKKDALTILKKRKNVRLININEFNLSNKKSYLFLENIILTQDSNKILFKNRLKVVTKKKPSIKQLNSLKFAFNICKFVKSNAIVLVNDQSTIGIGAGQASRLDSCKIASDKAQEFVPTKLLNSVAASDAFFPFSDGVKKLIEAGVKAIIQPGGSVNDKEIIKAADEAGVTMIFTGTRHFRH
jgi:phosphoribosylaminoimidazolecarboxamide formyltransferase / IMP cyclohydrolase